MSLIDFGQNQFQYAVGFKYNCLGATEATKIVRTLVERNLLVDIASDKNAGETTISKGDGTEQNPLYSTRIGTDKLYSWTGWYVTFAQWKVFRDSIFVALFPILEEVGADSVATLTSQYGIEIPTQQFRKDLERDFSKAKEILSGLVPEDFVNAEHGYLLISDVSRSTQLEMTLSPALRGGSRLVFGHKLLKLDLKQPLAATMKAHAAAADKAAERFSQGLVTHFLLP